LSADALKRRAAERAVDLVQSGMRLGLGTGSTARHVLDVLAERLRTGALRDVAGVPTSRATDAWARELGVPLLTLDALQRLDLAIDGADEVDPTLDLIKGLGGALLWEKIVACAADRVAIVVDAGKRVDRLGTRSPVPVEVVPFGWRTHLAPFEALGCVPVLRTGVDARPVMTDGGHYLIDCRFPDGIADAERTERLLRARPGVVETGLFLGIATDVIVAAADGVSIISRSGP
jgi:ribose 5-phosphate isomerase A